MMGRGDGGGHKDAVEPVSSGLPPPLAGFVAHLAALRTNPSADLDIAEEVARLVRAADRGASALPQTDDVGPRLEALETELAVTRGELGQIFVDIAALKECSRAAAADAANAAAAAAAAASAAESSATTAAELRAAAERAVVAAGETPLTPSPPPQPSPQKPPTTHGGDHCAVVGTLDEADTNAVRGTVSVASDNGNAMPTKWTQVVATPIADGILRRLKDELSSAQRMKASLEVEVEEWRAETSASREFQKKTCEEIVVLQRRVAAAESQFEALCLRAEQREREDEERQLRDRAREKAVANNADVSAGVEQARIKLTEGVVAQLGKDIERMHFRAQTFEDVARSLAQQFDVLNDEQRGCNMRIKELQTATNASREQLGAVSEASRTKAGATDTPRVPSAGWHVGNPQQRGAEHAPSVAVARSDVASSPSTPATGTPRDRTERMQSSRSPPGSAFSSSGFSSVQSPLPPENLLNGIVRASSTGVGSGASRRVSAPPPSSGRVVGHSGRSAASVQNQRPTTGSIRGFR